MRILHVLDHSAPLQSGYVFRTLGLMRAQAAHGWEPVALTSPEHAEAMAQDDRLEEHAGFRFHRTPPARRIAPLANEAALMRATYRRVLEVARAERVDLIHAHSPVLNAWPAIWAGRKLGLPSVYEIRAFWEDAAVDNQGGDARSFKYRATRKLETGAARRVDALVAICAGIRDEMIDRGIPPGKVSIAPNAIDPERFPPIVARDVELEASLGVAEDRLVGFVGSFYGYEGLDLLIDAYPAIRAAVPNARLLFVGGGPEDARLREKAAPLGDRAIFTGRVPNEEVRRYYSLFDLLTYPRRKSRLTDLTTPLKPLEAMAMTRDFIASDVGGHRELIGDGRPERLFAADDAGALAQAVVAALTSNSAARLASGRRFVETERSWSALVARYEQVYAGAQARRRAA